MAKKLIEIGHKSDEEFDKFYNETCTKCYSTSCEVKGGWRNPCFIEKVAVPEVKEKGEGNDRR